MFRTYRLLIGLLAIGLAAELMLAGMARADDTPNNPPNNPPPRQRGGDGPPGDGQRDNQRGPGRPAPGFRLLPRFVVDQLDLTDDQKKQIDDLEAETKAKLAKILTADQMKAVEQARPPRPGGPGGPGGDQGGRRGPGGQGGGGDQGGRPGQGPN